MLRSEAHARVLRFDDDLSRARSGRKLDVQRARVFLVDLDALDLLELLDARLDLIRLGGLVAEALDELLGLLDHLLLVQVGRHLLLAPFSPQLDIPAVRDLVVVRLAERQLDRARGDVVQKGPVVRDQHDGPVVFLEVALQPLDALDIEVIRRLVEQEDRRAAQQQLGQLDAHAPAAAELACRAREVFSLETEPEQRFLDLLLAVLAAEDMEAVRRVVEPVQQFLVLGALVVGPLGDLRRQAVDLLFQIEHFGESRLGLGIERRRVGHLHLLGQVSDRALAVTRDAARGGRLLPDEHLEHRRLARSVLAHQTDPVFGVDQKRYLLE